MTISSSNTPNSLRKAIRCCSVTCNLSSSNPFGITDIEARKLGFVSAYARSNYTEDFAETAAIILLMSKAEYDALLASITVPAAVTAIKKKEAIVVQYYRDAFNIDFYALRDEAQKNTTAVLNN